ncbi:STT3 domain-containing protein [Helicobacter turcicus]|uniref:Dolichyl-diphosphooligosaccharide--protein glycosyltransferase subunit STT3 n=1 Tax=Helicobacter turcicus TaxID=2867412 RepID=A0ABS7JP60_9HELI|nr:STT3 domain-containing protein [Helicobacter turcicus]MBX7491149.1 dolichyl-diphosphooligosaccharide--protein glycosyltransferase subunit STT3 [Helicobacter turcicus]MBX7546016.1 dolichyl-diphosphooligosaccharide--protein glycosyltransferase subunit STT3 [Helicobacter turcicus]
MLKTIFLPQNIRFLHFIFITILCSIHFGFHYLDFKLLLDDPKNFVDGTLILTSFDAYHYAKGTREFLEFLKSPNFYTFNALSMLPFLSILGGILAKYTSLSFVLSFASVIFSATLAPIMYALNYFVLNLLSQKRYFCNNLLAFTAFLASLIALFLPSFYQRVGAGYFDTDMLLLTLPLCALFFLLKFTNATRFSYLVLFAAFGFLAINWHNGIQNIFLLGFLLFLILEILCALRFRSISQESLMLASSFFVILTPSAPCFIVLIALLLAFRFCPKGIWLYFGISIIYAIAFDLFNPLIAQINAYIFGATQHTSDFIFASVVNTILETSPTTLSVLIARNGGILIFMLGILGFGALLYNAAFVFFKMFIARKNPSRPILYLSIFLLPFCILGFYSLNLGVRFSFFLTPIVSLGITLFLLIFFSKCYRYLPLCVFASAIILPLSLTTLRYSIPKPILSAEEIHAFKILDSKLSANDFIFSWWDYGYALRYYTKAQIFLDGGRHSGAVNYPIAKILLSNSPKLFYNFSLLLAQNLQNTPKKMWNQIFALMLKDKSPQDFLDSLKQDYQNRPLANNAQVYWVLPMRVLPLLANINTFANLNLKTGKPLKDSGIFAYFNNTKNSLNYKINQEINIYQYFYTHTFFSASKTPLTQINFGQNSLLLDTDYLKSNIISAMIFQKLPQNICASGKNVRIYHLKDSKCAELPAH